MQPRQHRLADTCGVINLARAERLLEELRDPYARIGRVAIAREIHQARNEPPQPIVPHEQAQTAAFLEPQHPVRDLGQLGRRHLEQLVAGIRLEDLDEVPAAVTRRWEPRTAEHLPYLAPQQRDAIDTFRVDGGGKEPDEAALPHRLALGVESFDPDVVQMRRAVDGRSRRRLGHDDDRRIARECLDTRRQGPWRRPIVAQDAERRGRVGTKHGSTAHLGKRVVGVPQEREVVVGQPLQQLMSLIHVGHTRRRGIRDQPIRDLERPRPHGLPIADDQAYVLEHTTDRFDHLLVGRGIDQGTDLEMHPRFGDTRRVQSGL